MSLLQNQTLSVTVKSPEKTIFQGNAVAVSSVSTTGPFDILPYHANLIAIIKDSVTIFETQEKKQVLKIEKGFVKVFENTVNIFLGIETVL